jgi:hypothetical protein
LLLTGDFKAQTHGGTEGGAQLRYKTAKQYGVRRAQKSRPGVVYTRVDYGLVCGQVDCDQVRVGGSAGENSLGAGASSRG